MAWALNKTDWFRAVQFRWQQRSADKHGLERFAGGLSCSKPAPRGQVLRAVEFEQLASFGPGPPLRVKRSLAFPVVNFVVYGGFVRARRALSELKWRLSAPRDAACLAHYLLRQ